MAEADLGGRRVDTDLRLWDDETRRIASLIVLGLAGVFLVGALLYFGLDAAGSGWFLWTAIVVLAILLLAETAIIATGIAREEDGPAWLAGPQAQAATAGASATATTGESAGAGPAPEAEPEPAGGGQAAGTEHVHVDLKCPECAELFSVHDTGERPLHTQCPHCGAEGHVDLEAPPPESVHDGEPAGEETAPGAAGATGAAAGGGDVEAEPAPEQEAPTETISIKCPACETQFDVEDDGTRPLEATCPGCGRGGKLKG